MRNAVAFRSSFTPACLIVGHFIATAVATLRPTISNTPTVSDGIAAGLAPGSHYTHSWKSNALGVLGKFLNGYQRDVG
jgi:hypothetical protein